MFSAKVCVQLKNLNNHPKNLENPENPENLHFPKNLNNLPGRARDKH